MRTEGDTQPWHIGLKKVPPERFFWGTGLRRQLFRRANAKKKIVKNFFLFSLKFFLGVFALQSLQSILIILGGEGDTDGIDEFVTWNDDQQLPFAIVFYKRMISPKREIFSKNFFLFSLKFS